MTKMGVPVGDGGANRTWIELLEAVLDARTRDPADVSEGIWNAFLVFSLILIPSIQGW